MRQEKLTKLKRILNYIKFLCITFVANCSNVPNIYYSQKEFKHFGLEILVIHGILKHIVLNIFRYILYYICNKFRKEKKLKYPYRFFNFIRCHRDFNALKLYTLTVYSVKIDSICFFSSPGQLKFKLFFVKIFALFKFNAKCQKSNKNCSIRIIFIEMIIEINIIKVNTNNTRFITIKYSFTRIFIKIEYPLYTKQ